MKHTLPELGYEYDALEPYIDAETMKIHHTKHHQAYTDKFNAAIDGTEFAEMQAEEVIVKLELVPEGIRNAVRNNGGGYVNHKFFWSILKVNDGVPENDVTLAIKTQYGSFDAFKDEFSNAAATRFGSGWAWLVVNPEKKLEVISTANQDSPVTDGLVPLIALDVWEHAYYLKYQNRRPEYIENFFKVINWEKVNELYSSALR